MFALGGRAGEDELVGVGDGGFFLEEALSGEIGLFADEGAVHQEKGLGGEIGDGAFSDDKVGVGCVEDLEEIEHGIAEPRNVDAAAFGSEGVVEIVLSGVADGGTAACRVELAAEEEGGVADGFGFESFAIGVAEEAVCGVAVVGSLRGKLVGSAEGDFADEGFDGPAVFDEAEGEMVEEFGVTGELAGLAEVIGGANDAFTEEVFPNAVDHDAGGEGVFGIGDPVGEFESAGVFGRNVSGGSGFHGDGDESAGDLRAFVADLASNVDVAIGDGLRFGGSHRDGLKFFEFGGKGFVIFFEGLEVGFDFLLINFLSFNGRCFGGARFDEIDGIGDDVIFGAFGGDGDGGGLVFGEGEGANACEATVSGRGLALIDGDGGLSFGMADGDGGVGGAVGPRAVGNEDFIVSCFGESCGELDLLFTFEEVVVVKVIFADPRACGGGFCPVASELGVGGINDDAGQAGRFDRAFGGLFSRFAFEGGDLGGECGKGIADLLDFARVCDLEFGGGEGGDSAGGAAFAHRHGALEDAGEGVVVGDGDGVEFVVVAAGTAEGHAKKGAANGVDLFVDKFHFQEFVVLKFVVEGTEDEVAAASELGVPLLD